MRRFLAIFVKEFRQIRRDPLSLGFLVLVPVVLLIMYGYALSFDVRHIRLAVLDEDRTQESREFLDSVFQNSYFNRGPTLQSDAETDDILAQGSVRAVLRIPRGFARGLLRGDNVNLQFLIDGADANTAAVTAGYMEALCARATLNRRLDALSAAGLSGKIPVIATEPRIWFNPNLESSHFLVPGLIGMLLMLAAVVATSLSIVREKERETMEQIMVSPVHPVELILGKTVPYVLICLVTMTLVLLMGRLLFGVVVVGSIALLALATFVFLLAALGMGLLISASTNSQQIAFQVAIITSLLPSLILSGLIFPIKNMPLPIQGLTLIVIPRYFISALRGVILKGATFMDIWPQLAAMLGLAFLFNLLAILKTRKVV
jgi:ABC-2 type transport system permease protein